MSVPPDLRILKISPPDSAPFALCFCLLSQIGVATAFGFTNCPALPNQRGAYVCNAIYTAICDITPILILCLGGAREVAFANQCGERIARTHAATPRGAILIAAELLQLHSVNALYADSSSTDAQCVAIGYMNACAISCQCSSFYSVMRCEA